MELNKQQIMASVGTVLTAAGSVAVLTGSMTPDQWAGMSQSATAAIDAGITVIGAIGTVVGLVVTWWNSRKAAQILAAKSIDGVQVHVDTSFGSPAPAAIKALAKDKAVTDVVPMGPGGPVAK